MIVDLPIPGSPPTSRAEPGTRPPPQTRSNSLIPVARRGGASSVVFRSSSVNCRPRTRLRASPPMGGAAPSSVIVFQPPQASHLPDHLEWTAPQDWQTKDGETLAVDKLIDVGIAAVVDLGRRSGPDDLALIEHGDAVGNLARTHHVMSNGER